MLLWPFNHYPGTDYETYNWEWLIKLGKRWEDIWPRVESATNSAEESATAAANSASAAADSADAAAESANAAASIFNYVTPEMYGAAGDGVQDDSDAFEQALNSGKPVKCVSTSSYRIDNDINITGKNVDIDFNNATIVCNATFNIAATSYNQPSVVYTANSKTATNISAERGIINIIDDNDKINNAFKGFSTIVNDNQFSTVYPYNVSGHAVYYEHTEVNVKNIGNIVPVGTIRKSVFVVTGCSAYFENVNADQYGPLNILVANVCQLVCKHWNINANIRPSDNYHYGIDLSACSEFILDDIIGKADWHIVTTADSERGQCLNGLIMNSNFKSYTHVMYAYLEHAGTAINTTLDNVYTEGGITCGGTIKNSRVDILPWQICPVTDAAYTQDMNIENCHLYKSATMNYHLVYAVDVPTTPQVGNITLKNVFLDFNSNSFIETRQAEQVTAGKLILDNIKTRITAGMAAILGCTSASRNAIYSEIVVKNTVIKEALNQRVNLGATLRVIGCTDDNSGGDAKIYVTHTPIIIERCNFDSAQALKARNPGSQPLTVMYSRYDKDVQNPSSGSQITYTKIYCCDLDYTAI